MSRTRVRRRRLIAAVALGVLGLVGGRAASASVARPDVVAYVVRGGDTVWGLAERVAGPSGDPRPVVDAIEAANHLQGSRLVPGQHLLLPAPAGR